MTQGKLRRFYNFIKVESVKSLDVFFFLGAEVANNCQLKLTKKKKTTTTTAHNCDISNPMEI